MATKLGFDADLLRRVVDRTIGGGGNTTDSGNSSGGSKRKNDTEFFSNKRTKNESDDSSSDSDNVIEEEEEEDSLYSSDNGPEEEGEEGEEEKQNNSNRRNNSNRPDHKDANQKSNIKFETTVSYKAKILPGIHIFNGDNLKDDPTEAIRIRKHFETLKPSKNGLNGPSVFDTDELNNEALKKDPCIICEYIKQVSEDDQMHGLDNGGEGRLKNAFEAMMAFDEKNVAKMEAKTLYQSMAKIWNKKEEKNRRRNLPYTFVTYSMVKRHMTKCDTSNTTRPVVEDLVMLRDLIHELSTFPIGRTKTGKKVCNGDKTKLLLKAMDQRSKAVDRLHARLIEKKQGKTLASTNAMIALNSGNTGKSRQVDGLFKRVFL